MHTFMHSLYMQSFPLCINLNKSMSRFYSARAWGSIANPGGFLKIHKNLKTLTVKKWISLHSACIPSEYLSVFHIRVSKRPSEQRSVDHCSGYGSYVIGSVSIYGGCGAGESTHLNLVLSILGHCSNKAYYPLTCEINCPLAFSFSFFLFFGPSLK